MYILYISTFLFCLIWLVFVAKIPGKKKNSQVRTRKILFGDLLERVDKHLEQFDVVPLAGRKPLLFFFRHEKLNTSWGKERYFRYIHIFICVYIYIYVCIYLYICVYIFIYMCIYIYIVLFFFLGGGGGGAQSYRTSAGGPGCPGVDKKLCIPLESKVFFDTVVWVATQKLWSEGAASSCMVVPNVQSIMILIKYHVKGIRYLLPSKSSTTMIHCHDFQSVLTVRSSQKNISLEKFNLHNGSNSLCHLYI